jgi:hypothetical protein
MISGRIALLLIVAALLIFGLFFSPFSDRIPGWLRTMFAIVLAIVAFIWLLNLLGVLVF